MMETLEEDQLCFPQLLNTSCRKPMHPQTGDMLLYLRSFISLLTAALNLLVIVSISHFRKLHTTTNFVLLSLAVSDFLVGLVAMPGEINSTDTCWLLGDLMCALYYLFSLIIISASIASMVLISVDRYVAICFPLHYPTKVTIKKVQISVCMSWIYSVFYNTLFLYDDLKQPGRYNSCYGECIVSIGENVDLVFSFIIPISLIVTLYLRVFAVAVSQARAMRSHIAVVTLQRSGTVTPKRSELKAARTLGIVVAVFLMCYCPYYCVFLTGGKILFDTTAMAFITFLLLFNSCLNPVIYAFLYPWFRKAIRLIVTLQIMQPGSCEINIL